MAAFDACGAAENELRRIGYRGPHHRSGRPVAGGGALESLTGRELQVARLVVDRRSNAGITAALFLSQKTVETHLRNLFHKLGVSSRAEVVRSVDASTAGAWCDSANSVGRAGVGHPRRPDEQQDHAAREQCVRAGPPLVGAISRTPRLT
jgi:DNA-binding CsgD family transcriptional regulator